MDNRVKQRLENTSLVVGSFILADRLNKLTGLALKPISAKFVFNKVSEPIVDEFKKAANEAKLVKPEIFGDINIIDFGTNSKAYIDIFRKRLKLLNESYDKLIDRASKDSTKKIYQNLHKRSVKRLKTKFRMIKNGENAFYSYAPKSIMINMNKLPGAIFHEFGHHYNSKVYSAEVLKAMSYFRISKVRTLLTAPILMTAVLTRKQDKVDKDTKDKGSLQKGANLVRNFVKNYAWFFAGSLPLTFVFEEWQASIIAGKVGSKLLKSPEAKNILRRNNIGSMISYAKIPLAAGLSVYLTNKISDKIFEQNLFGIDRDKSLTMKK